MTPQPTTDQTLRAENAELRARLEEAEEMLRAIRAGEVDALVVEGDAGPQLFTLQGLDAAQNRFRGEMLAQVSDAVIAVDTEERVTFLNAAAERQYGVRAGDVLGRTLTAIFTPHWPSPESEAGMRTAMGERGEWRGELIHRTPDGRELHVETSATTLRDPDGAGIGYVAAIRDIHEWKQTRAAMTLTNERFDLAVKCSQVVLFQQDLELRYTWLQNPVPGFKGPDAIGKRDADLMERAADAALTEALKREVIRSGVSQRQEVLVQIQGAGRHYDLLVEPLRDAAGLISGVTCAAIDITDRKQAEEAVARLAAIVESSHDALFGEDLDGTITSWNRGAEQIFGFSADEIVGTSIMRLIPADRQAAEHELQHKLAAGERGGTLEAIQQTKDGREFHASITISPLKDAAGKVIGTARVVRDITERKHAEAALRKSERQYSALANASSEVAYRMSADWSLMLPLDGRDLVPSSDQPLGDWAWLDRNVPRDEHARVRQAISEAIARKTLFELEHRVRRPDGSIGWTFSRAAPIFDENEGVIAWFGAASDITARKAAEEALRVNEERSRTFAVQLEQLVGERTEELERSQVRLRAFAAELNLAEHRERKRLADELHDYLAQLLVLCRLNLGQIKPIGLPPKAEEKVRDTEEVLTKALQYCRTLMAELSPPVLHEHGLPAALGWLGEQMARRGLTVRVDVGGAADVRLPDDSAVLLFQSVRELLLNALKYAECHEVVLRMKQAGGRLRIEICDDGVGFDPVAADLYSPTALSSKFGLFSIRERMTGLGGWFDLKSSPGKGTTAALVMPLERAEVNVQNAEPIGGVASRSDDSARHQQDTNQIRVLLVDDHAMVRQGLKSVLDGYADIKVVGEAWDGKEAIALTERLRPVIVLMDINMPKMNGIEATAHIKAQYPEIIVIGLSVQTGGENEVAMRNAGAVRLLTKEAAVEELYKAIRESLDVRLKGKVLSHQGE